ncbi:hypothetical protein HPC49_27275 [Pyxidicoccus fallax]|uniref:NAD glycohydrolase translocation F5/8 type C domain-containing protein n=1 Tax=Pyxidicoccus fallax TaxID=394095 RepID=A0A848LIG4_9BACT|nr:hypothetical protein [Pyxidicoccus fallax]NMO17513.1 hypothetical protein [Pyxidicoccus fallax]NPC81908.1 hypothetical protein [Pyxidicoccus fallax]
MRLALLTLFVPCLATAGGFQRLHAEEASATSFLQNNWNKYQENYHPSYALDDDPKTAWVEGAEGDGVGESLTVPVSNLASARAVRVVLFNGYQKSPALLAANGAPKQLTVTVRGPGGKESGRQQLTLERKMGPQSFDIPVSGPVADVVLTVDSVHAGSKYRDTCVSDVQVFVDSDVPYNAAAEKAKREALLRWKKERLSAAKYYASLPATYPYSSTHFDREDDDRQLLAARFTPKLVPVKGFPSLLERLRQADALVSKHVSEQDRALLQELEKLSTSKPSQDGRWYSLAQKGRTVPPENFSVPSYVHGLFQLRESSLFEAKGLGAKQPSLAKAELFGEVETRSNLLLLEGTTSDVRKVYFTNTRLVVERGTYTENTHVLALLEGGKVSRIVTYQRGEDAMEGTVTSVKVMAPTYSGDKVSGLDVTTLWDWEAPEDFAGEDVGLSVSQTKFQALERS